MHQRQDLSSEPPSPPVFLSISTHFTATPRIPLAPTSLQPSSFGCTSEVKPRDFTSDIPSACALFTPNESEQRLRSLYYRCCWHRVSNLFLCRYHQIPTLFISEHCSRLTGVYNPKTFIPHAASLRQACAHCERFETAATRRCEGRVSVPLWVIILSDHLLVKALVGRYPAN